MVSVSPVEVASEVLTERDRLRARMRGRRRAGWFVPVMLGLLVLASAPFYWRQIAACPGGRSACVEAAFPGPLANAVGPMPTSSGLGAWATLYWVCALATALVAGAVFLRRRSRRSGVDVATWPAVVAGAVVAAYLVLTSPAVVGSLSSGRAPVGLLLPDLHLRGLTPLLVLAVALGVLALAERSRALGIGAALFAGVAVVANLYDLSNLAARLGWQLSASAGPLANVVIPGLVLLGVGAAEALSERWSLHVAFEARRRG